MAVQQIGRYRILRELGRGSAAVVYQGRDPDSGKQVAIKVFYTNVIAAEGFAARFAQVLPALRALEHPYLVPLLDYGQEGGEDAGSIAGADVAYYLVQRYMPGGTLAERMDGRPLLLAEVVPILQRLAEALDAAHTVHLLHGALHPGHVMFDLHNRAFLADLGLAALLHAAPSTDALPLPNMPAARPTGTPAYLSPEQISGLPLDGRADVYALGVMLVEMLTGRQPYEAANTDDLLRQHLEAPVPQLSEAQLSRLVLPAEFNTVLARALAKNRDARYPTAGILAEAMRTMFLMAPGDLAALEPASPPPAAPVAPPPKVEPPPPVEAAPAAEPAPPPVEAPLAPDAEATVVAAEAPAEPPVTEADLPASPDEPPPSEPAGPPPPPPPPGPRVVPLAMADEVPTVIEWVQAPETAPRRQLPGWGWAGIGLVLLLLLYVLWRTPAVMAIINPPTATPTPTATATITLTPSPTNTATASHTPTASATFTDTPTATASPSSTVTLTASLTPIPSATATFLPTFTPTLPTATSTLSVQSAPFFSPTPTP